MNTVATPAPRGLSRETLLLAVLGVMNALSCVSFIEPSPYEFLFILLIPVSVMTGLVLTRTTLAFFFLVFTTVAAQLVALFPYLQHQPVEGTLTPSFYTVSTVYLYASALLFALIFSRNSEQRLTVCIRAYAWSCVFAGLWGFASYLDIGGLGEREPILGRVAGPFKDPNVLGSYCVFGALYFLQRAVLGRGAWRLASFAGFGIVMMGGVFLSFSRGSWGAVIFAMLLMGVSTYVTAENGWVRRRIRRAVLILAITGAAGVMAIIATPTLRDTFIDRAQVAQDYDSGETGRFGNQRRSISMLLDRPFGFGPFRFPVYFTLQPHNSYVGAFADGGWIGGFSFLLLVFSSSLIALQLLFRRSPLLRQMQVAGPALLAFFLQGFQIDIDHWRFMFLILGAVWGIRASLESGRLRSARGLDLEAQPIVPALRQTAA